MRLQTYVQATCRTQLPEMLPAHHGVPTLPRGVPFLLPCTESREHSGKSEWSVLGSTHVTVAHTETLDSWRAFLSECETAAKLVAALHSIKLFTLLGKPSVSHIHHDWQFLCPSSGGFSLYTQQCYVIDVCWQLHVSNSSSVHHQEVFHCTHSHVICHTGLLTATCFGQFLCPSSGGFHCTHRNVICHTGLLTATCFGQFLCPSSGGFHCTHSNVICHTGLLTATCFGQFLCPSSGVFHCTHSTGICHTVLLTASELSADLYDIYRCCVYSEKLLMMGRETVRNI